MMWISSGLTMNTENCSTSFREVVIYVSLHPWEIPSQISGLNNGFRILFILCHSLSLSGLLSLSLFLSISLSLSHSLSFTWPAILVIIAAGYHKCAAVENSLGL